MLYKQKEEYMYVKTKDLIDKTDARTQLEKHKHV